MIETPHWQFDLEVHPAGWNFPAGQSWIAGWIWSPVKRLVTDLRVWIDGRPILAIWGLPKPGLDERFLHRPGPPYLGFTVLVTPHAGASQLRLEVRDQTGAWTEIFRTTITVAAEAGPAPVSPKLSGLLPVLTNPLLRLHRQRPATPLAALADEVVSGALAEPLDSLPNPPFHGALEEPRDRGWIRYGRLSITGWLAHRTARITRMTAMVDPLQESALLQGLKRDDVNGIFADLPGSETSAFVGHVDLPADTTAPCLLKIFAELDGGEKHLVFAQRFTPRVIAGAEAPLPTHSRLGFARSAWALRGSARRHGLSRESWSMLRPAIASAWSAFTAEAPARPTTSRLATPALPEHLPVGPLRILIVTHNLNFEGAPWFIFELARHLAGQPGVTVRVLSPQDGPMCTAFADAGMPVEVLDLAPALHSTGPEEFNAALTRATASLPWVETNLVIANTMVSFWAIHAAAAAGKPSLLYVHESSAIRRFFAPLLPPGLFPVIEAAFRQATRVVFTADSTRAVHAALGQQRNFALLPSWVDIGRIDTFAAANPPARLRQKHGLDPTAVLIVNIGSVCERKGQHIYIRGIDLLRKELPALHPGQKIQWVMVGAREGLYMETLQEDIQLMGLEEVVIIPETPDIYDFYHLADLLVCTSFEESFPRVLLEAMVFGTRIVSTDVNGIPEMLTNTDEAWLVPAGDPFKLATALKQALAQHFAGDTKMLSMARARAARSYHHARALPPHLQVVREAWLG